jgi:3-hydroxyacyl-CoA dehydrogenase
MKKVGVIGTGTIGASWAALFLARGLETHAHDPAVGAERRLRDFIDSAWPSLQALGLSPGADIGNLHFHSALSAAVEEAEFIQESGPEDEGVKIDLYRRIDTAAPPNAIIASSSSHLSMDRIQSECARPERCVHGHPFNPPHLIPLVEVMGGERSSPEFVDRAIAFYTSIGKSPIRVLKAQHGNVGNRLQRALWQEAARMVAEGYVSAEDVETALCKGPGLRWAISGHFSILNLAGGERGFRGWMQNVSGLKVGDKIGATTLTQDLLDKLLAGIAFHARERTIPEMVEDRDEKLVAILKIVDANRDVV